MGIIFWKTKLRKIRVYRKKIEIEIIPSRPKIFGDRNVGEDPSDAILLFLQKSPSHQHKIFVIQLGSHIFGELSSIHPEELLCVFFLWEKYLPKFLAQTLRRRHGNNS